jgi:hypothetical protein
MYYGRSYQQSFSTPSLEDDKLIQINNNLEDEDNTQAKKFKRIDPSEQVEYSTEDVTKIIKGLFGSVQNVLQYCGVGTYLLAGPTNAGKTFSIESMVQLAQLFSDDYQLDPIEFTSTIIFSSTDEISNDFQWAEGHIKKVAQQDKKLLEFLEIRKKEIMKGAKLHNCAVKEYIKRFPMLVVIDDFVGALNGTGANSPLAVLASKARHLGLYVMLLVQSIKQIGPGVRKNARAIIGFRLELSAIQDILKEFYGIVNNYNQAISIFNHMSVTYTPAIFILNWLLNDPMYNNITRRVLLTPPFPSDFEEPVTWSDPNEYKYQEEDCYNKNFITDE